MATDRKTTIANIALKALGAGRIDDITADDPVALSCYDMVDLAIEDYADQVVSPVMVTRSALVPAGEPVDGYGYSYNVPDTTLRPLRLESGSGFYREGGFIHTDDEAAVLVFVTNDFDPEDLPSYAVEAIGYRLALALASDLGKDDRIGIVAQKYRDAIAKAKAVEGRYNQKSLPALWGAS